MFRHWSLELKEIGAAIIYQTYSDKSSVFSLNKIQFYQISVVLLLFLFPLLLLLFLLFLFLFHLHLYLTLLLFFFILSFFHFSPSPPPLLSHIDSPRPSTPSLSLPFFADIITIIVSSLSLVIHDRNWLENLIVVNIIMQNRRLNW